MKESFLDRSILHNRETENIIELEREKRDETKQYDS
jgi:hypothetical protein